MATKDDFHLVLSDYDENYGEESDQPGTGIAWHRAVISPRILAASIVGATAAAIVFAVVAVGKPLELFTSAKLFTDAKLFRDVKAFLVDLSAPQDGTREEKPIIQSSAVAESFPPVASEAPTSNEIAVPFKTADQSQTELRQAPAEALLGQFQAWAAGQDARAE